MTVICIGYFDKFSRFFLDIKKHLQNKSSNTVNFKIYSIHLSGFLYNCFRLKFSSWITVKAWLKVLQKKQFYKNAIDSSETYKGIPYHTHIGFHISLNRNISETALQLQALAYIDIFDEQFRKERPNYLLVLGDSRLCVEIAVAVARKNNIPIRYIEQGPFKTTFFDDKGVNANLSIRNRKHLKSMDMPSETTIDHWCARSKPYNRSPFYRGMDFIFARLFEKTVIYPPDLKFTDIIAKRVKQVKQRQKTTEWKKDSVLLILQVPLDVNMIYHSPHYKTHSAIIKSVYLNLPKDVNLIVREHPLYINKYDASVYDFIKQNNIIIDNNMPLHQAIEMAKVVVVNNSTVGIEAIFSYKTVVVLGNAFYDNASICLKLDNKEGLSELLESALKNVPNKVKIDTFKNALSQRVLLCGAITDETLQSSKTIANQLLAK